MTNQRPRCIFWSREVSSLGVKVAMFSSRGFEALEELSGQTHGERPTSAI
jgi:hypothetical protein